MGNIDSMLYQVRVPLRNASFLRFKWRKDGYPYKSVNEYQMVLHLFGATSSPSCANFCLKKQPRIGKDISVKRLLTPF